MYKSGEIVAFKNKNGEWVEARVSGGQPNPDGTYSKNLYISDAITSVSLEEGVPPERVMPAAEARQKGLLGPSKLPPSDPSKIDLRALEKAVFAEINKIHSDPNALAVALEKMKATVFQDGSGSPAYILPDNSVTVIPTEKTSVLLSAIDDARRAAKAGLSQLAWSDGLANMARKYAETNPSGHGDMGGRFAAAGVSKGAAESISYGGNTAIQHTYGLYIDSGNLNPGTGHRDMMINLSRGNNQIQFNAPAYTHVGVGCAYIPSRNSIICVVDYAAGWVDIDKLPKLVVGQTYAHLLPDGKSFEYVKLTNAGPVYGYSVIMNSGSQSGSTSNIFDFIPVSEAKARNLVATNTEDGAKVGGGQPTPPTSNPTPQTSSAAKASDFTKGGEAAIFDNGAWHRGTITEFETSNGVITHVVVTYSVTEQGSVYESEVGYDSTSGVKTNKLLSLKQVADQKITLA